MGGASDAAYRGEAEGPIFVALARDGAPAGHPQGAAPRPALRLPPGHREEPLRDLGRAPRLLPALGEPGRPARAPGLRAGGRGAASALRRDLHRPAARQPLAGRGDRLRARAHLRARGTDAPPRGGHLGLQHRPGQRRLAGPDGRAHRPDPRALRARQAALRPGGARAAVRDAPHLARRDVDPRPHRGGGGRRLPAAAEARRRRQGRARLARLALALG